MFFPNYPFGCHSNQSNSAFWTKCIYSVEDKAKKLDHDIYWLQWHTFILRSNIGSYRLIIPKYGVHISISFKDTRQNHWTMKYRSQWPTFIFRSKVMSYWLIIPKYDVHAANSLQDIRQNHWTMNYRPQWSTFILRSNVGPYCLIILKYDVHIKQSSIYLHTGFWYCSKACTQCTACLAVV